MRSAGISSIPIHHHDTPGIPMLPQAIRDGQPLQQSRGLLILYRVAKGGPNACSCSLPIVTFLHPLRLTISLWVSGTFDMQRWCLSG